MVILWSTIKTLQNSGVVFPQQMIPNSWGFFVAFLQQQKGRPNIRVLL
jgi:hypothetical protein